MMNVAMAGGAKPDDGERLAVIGVVGMNSPRSVTGGADSRDIQFSKSLGFAYFSVGTIFFWIIGSPLVERLFSSFSPLWAVSVGSINKPSLFPCGLDLVVVSSLDPRPIDQFGALFTPAVLAIFGITVIAKHVTALRAMALCAPLGVHAIRLPLDGKPEKGKVTP